MLLLRTRGFSSDRLRQIPKVQKKYHDLDFSDEILPQLMKNSYSDKLIMLIKMISAFDPIERITLDEAINYLDKYFN